MCKVLEVNSSNYYSFQRRKINKPKDPDHDDIIGWIQDIAEFSGYTYGERRIKASLDALSFPMSRYKVVKLMKEADVWVRSKKKYKVTTNCDHKLYYYFLHLFKALPNRQNGDDFTDLMPWNVQLDFDYSSALLNCALTRSLTIL